VNVSAPSLDLVFDLPGIPYREPCFANTALRKIPKPPKLPPQIPDLPNPPNPPFGGHGNAGPQQHGDPVWSKGLIGVVYEVTPEDYAHIVATEGGGASYHDILVPCIPLPASVTVPEKPPIELPRPFVAHTLYAPQLPPTDGGDDRSTGDDDDDDGKKKLPDWLKKLLLPIHRPDPLYSQPSVRYLQLLIDGAKEHELPQDYQTYLAGLHAYRITSLRQQIGFFIFVMMWGPFFLIFLQGSKYMSDKDGRLPTWLSMTMAVVFNLVWMSYDMILKPLFGDGERTEEKDDTTTGERSLGTWRRQGSREAGTDEEKRGLMEWME
jgi:hypothetical protein